MKTWEEEEEAFNFGRRRREKKKETDQERCKLMSHSWLNRYFNLILAYFPLTSLLNPNFMIVIFLQNEIFIDFSLDNNVKTIFSLRIF